MFQIHNLGLFRADVQPQALFQPCSCRFKQLHRIAVLSAKDFEIISISNDIALFQIGFSELPILFDWSLVPFSWIFPLYSCLVGIPTH